ncbi:MAG: bifunctional DNA-formamidopyrimidine glycosylase/DNA-(apurinic or apyrimidinic site) lyase [Nocardioidaceae bacterium]
MPELPEVEVVRAGLARQVTGRRVEFAEVLTPRSVRRHLPGPRDFESWVVGVRLTGARRRGKYLWLPTDDGSALLAHLGMSGQLLVRAEGAPDEAHLRIRLRLDNRRELRFVDQRTFGGMWSSPHGAELPVEVTHIGRDLFDPEFDAVDVVDRLRRRRTGLKRALLDQTLVSGIGNIYADEALWRARLHFARPTATLRRSEGVRLLQAAGAVMHAALAEGGTSFDALYVNVNGESGYFDRSLQVYGRAGRPCTRCGTLIRRDPFMNRSSFTCPRCQPLPRNAAR